MQYFRRFSKWLALQAAFSATTIDTWCPTVCTDDVMPPQFMQECLNGGGGRKVPDSGPPVLTCLTCGNPADLATFTGSWAVTPPPEPPWIFGCHREKIPDAAPVPKLVTEENVFVKHDLFAKYSLYVFVCVCANLGTMASDYLCACISAWEYIPQCLHYSIN